MATVTPLTTGTTTSTEPNVSSGGRSEIDRRYSSVVNVFTALASPIRAAIVHRLTERNHNVQELVEALDLPQPLVSQHLTRLRSAGLVEGVRVGRTIVYRLVDGHVAHVFLDALHHAEETED